MDIEIFLDCTEVTPEDRPLALQKFKDWYADGAEIRCNKFPFNSLTALPQADRYLVDLGYADVITSLRILHAKVHHLGVKVFFHLA